VRAVRHVGITVSDFDRAVRFWTDLLGAPPRARTVLERPYVQRLVQLPGVRIDAAFFDLADTTLEVLEFHGPDRRPQAEDVFNPGHAHVCLVVDDIRESLAHAVRCGARALDPEGPVAIDAGPNAGAVAAYLRVPPDWHSVELYELPAP
jgi:catechol 2,3-dioxygenase-like lactoylglutathione lyase family enzyme